MNVKTLGITVLLVVVCVFMALATAPSWSDPLGGTFLQPGNVENLIRRTALFGVLGIGVSFVIISSGIDLSIGSVVCLSGCLLALFLKVDYRPFDQVPILAAEAASKSIVLEGSPSGLQVGDVIRYYGGRRARTLVATIQERRAGPVAVIEGTPKPNASVEGATTIEATILVLDAAPSADDTLGFVATTTPIETFGAGSEPRSSKLSIDSAVAERLAVRDQMLLVSPSSTSIKQHRIVSVENQTVTLDDDVSTSIDATWRALPLERRQRMSVPVALLSVLGIAAGLGVIHGLLVTRVRLQPFVVTLCGLLIYRSLSRWLVGDQPVGFGNEYEANLSQIGIGKWVIASGEGWSFGIPYPFFVMIAVAILAAVLLNLSVWGRYLLALGRNEEAARYSGIDTGKVTLAAYVFGVVLSAIGGILFALDANSVSPSSFGNVFELYAIAAAVLGGCSLRGGEGSIFGVIVGTAVMQVLNNMIVLLKISDTLEFAIIGMVILLGVIADETVRRVMAARRARSSAATT